MPITYSVPLTDRNKRRGRGRLLFLLGCAIFLAIILRPGPSSAIDAATAGALTLFFENDFFSENDSNYTNGIKLSWMSRNLSPKYDDGCVPGFCLPKASWLPSTDRPGMLRQVSFSIGQEIYTPRDKTRTDLITDDRPYAGWLYATYALHRRSPRALDRWDLTLGVVGPWSFAEETQKFFHRLIGNAEPQGWDNQLGNELGIRLTVERFGRFLRREYGRLKHDIIPHVGGAVGNVAINARTGAFFRIGHNLPRDFGLALAQFNEGLDTPAASDDPRISRDRRFALWLFAGGELRLVARDIFLDGNTFKHSNSVDKLPVVGEFRGGLAILYGRTKFAFTNIYRTKEFKLQSKPHIFGSFQISFTY